MKGLWWAHGFSRTNGARVQLYKRVYQKQLAFAKVLAAGPHGCSAKLGLTACLRASLSVRVWPSQTEYCHKESSMPGAHLHITSLKQKSKGALMQDGCFLKWRTIFFFISVPHKAATIPAPGVVFNNFLCNSRGHIMKWASCWKHMLFRRFQFFFFFYPWALGQPVPLYTPFFTLPIPQKPFPSI